MRKWKEILESMKEWLLPKRLALLLLIAVSISAAGRKHTYTMYSGNYGDDAGSCVLEQCTCGRWWICCHEDRTEITSKTADSILSKQAWDVDTIVVNEKRRKKWGFRFVHSAPDGTGYIEVDGKRYQVK